MKHSFNTSTTLLTYILRQFIQKIEFIGPTRMVWRAFIHGRQVAAFLAVACGLNGGFASVSFAEELHAARLITQGHSRLGRLGSHEYERHLAAGVSLRIPLGGRTRTGLEETRLSVGLQMRGNYEGGFYRPAFSETRPLLELSFGVIEGPESLALNGIELAKLHRLYAQGEGEQGENGEEDDGVNWWWVGGGIVGAGLVAGIIGAAAAGDDVVPDFEEGQMPRQ